jgi:hypothetical protein
VSLKTLVYVIIETVTKTTLFETKNHMLKKLILLFGLLIVLNFSVFAQNTKTLVLPKPTPEPPPGNIKLLEGYTHIKKRGIDTSVGEISKSGGLTIRYDIGTLAGRAAGYNCGEGQCLWYKKQIINGRDVWIGLTKKGLIVATFPEIYVNFFAQTKSPEDIADFLLMILTYGKDEPVTPTNSVQNKKNISKKPNNSENLFPVSENDKWGYVNEQGEMVIKPQFEMASEFKNGLAAVVAIDKVGYKNKYGYIDKSGTMVVEPQYDEAEAFSDGLAAVSKDYRWGYIDATGKEVIPLQFIEASNFSDGLAAVYVQSEEPDKDSQWGYINKKGEIVIPPKFYKAFDFHAGVARVTVGKFGEANLSGFIDKTGNFIVEPKFSLTGEFSEDLIPVEIGGRDRKDGEGIYTRISSKWGYIDKTGKVIIEPKFDNADEFSEGLANVTIGKKYGYIDTTGRMIIEPQFEFSSNSYRCAYFSEGLACFERDGKIGYIDKTGKVVIEPQFDFATKFVGGFAQVSFPASEASKGNKSRYRGGFGIIDKTGKIIWKPTG